MISHTLPALPSCITSVIRLFSSFTGHYRLHYQEKRSDFVNFTSAYRLHYQARHAIKTPPLCNYQSDFGHLAPAETPLPGESVMISWTLPALPSNFCRKRPFLSPFFMKNVMISWTLPAGNGARKSLVKQFSLVMALVMESVSTRNHLEKLLPGRFWKNLCKSLKLFNFTNYQGATPTGGINPW